MTRHLRNQVYAAIKELWPQSNSKLMSQAIYHWLVARGETVPDGALDKILTQLKKRGYIHAHEYMDSDGVKKHGNFKINWVHPILL